MHPMDTAFTCVHDCPLNQGTAYPTSPVIGENGRLEQERVYAAIPGEPD